MIFCEKLPQVILRCSKDGDHWFLGLEGMRELNPENAAPLSSLDQYARGNKLGDALISDREGGREE